MRTSKANVCRAYARRASGRRIAQEIDAIRTALKRRGYRIRKQPKQAAWAIYVTNDKFYLLTYQPAPISDWVLHPQDNDTSGDTLPGTRPGISNFQTANAHPVVPCALPLSSRQIISHCTYSLKFPLN